MKTIRLNKQSVFGFVLIRLCLVALVMRLDLQAQPVPPMPVTKLESPKAKASTALIVVPPPRIMTNVALSWTYDKPMPSPGIVFEVWRQTNAVQPVAYWDYRNGKWSLLTTPWKLSANWHLFATVSAPPFRFPNNLPHALFIVRAKDTSTSLVSNWASK